MTTAAIDDELLTYAETERALNIPIGTLYAMVSRRQIPYVRLSGRIVRFRRSDLSRWVEERHVPASEQRRRS